MAIVQFYNDDCEARLFEGDFTITLSNTIQKLPRKEVTAIFRKCGFKLKSKWTYYGWGWEAKFSRKSK
jgi:hypothetical protein